MTSSLDECREEVRTFALRVSAPKIHQVIQAEYLLGYPPDEPARRRLPPYPFPDDA